MRPIITGTRILNQGIWWWWVDKFKHMSRYLRLQSLL